MIGPAACALLALAGPGSGGRLLDLVRPIVGTARRDQRIGAANSGQTFPAVGVPFGMTHWTPLTQASEDKSVSPYYAQDERLQGIRASHFWSGSCTQDYGSARVHRPHLHAEVRPRMDEAAVAGEVRCRLLATHPGAAPVASELRRGDATGTVAMTETDIMIVALLLLIAALVSVASIPTMLRRCPNCGQRFHMKRWGPSWFHTYSNPFNSRCLNCGAPSGPYD